MVGRRKRYRVLHFYPFLQPTVSASEERRLHKATMQQKMEVFLAMRGNCRRREILAHFKEDFVPSKENRRVCCDNCSSTFLLGPDGKRKEDERVDFSQVRQKF